MLFVVLSFGNYFADWPAVQSAFGFNPTILFGIFELPIKYYIMLLDSRVSPLPPDPRPCGHRSVHAQSSPSF